MPACQLYLYIGILCRGGEMTDTDKILAKTLNLKLARIIRDNHLRKNNNNNGGGDDWWLSPKKKLECPRLITYSY